MLLKALNRKGNSMTDTSLTKAIDSQTHSVWQQLYRSQPFWVTVAAIGLCVVLSWAGTDSRGEQVFFTAQNFNNVALNFSFIGIIAI